MALNTPLGNGTYLDAITGMITTDPGVSATAPVASTGGGQLPLPGAPSSAPLPAASLTAPPAVSPPPAPSPNPQGVNMGDASDAPAPLSAIMGAPGEAPPAAGTPSAGAGLSGLWRGVKSLYGFPEGSPDAGPSPALAAAQSAASPSGANAPPPPAPSGASPASAQSAASPSGSNAPAPPAPSGASPASAPATPGGPPGMGPVGPGQMGPPPPPPPPPPSAPTSASPPSQASAPTDPARIAEAIHGMESGGASTSRTSVDGAVGGWQITPATFQQFAKPGETITNPTDNAAVGNRIVSSYAQTYGNDPARVAVAYFSGPDNVAPPGSPTPWKNDAKDGNGTSVSSYVSGVLSKLGVASPTAPAQGAPTSPVIPTSSPALSAAQAAQAAMLAKQANFNPNDPRLYSTPQDQILALGAGLGSGQNMTQGLAAGMQNQLALRNADRSTALEGMKASAQMGQQAVTNNLLMGRLDNQTQNAANGTSRVGIAQTNSDAQNSARAKNIDIRTQQMANNLSGLPQAAAATVRENVKDEGEFYDQANAARQSLQVNADLTHLLQTQDVTSQTVQDKIRNWISTNTGLQVGQVTPDGVALGDKLMNWSQVAGTLAQTGGKIPRANAEYQSIRNATAGTQSGRDAMLSMLGATRASDQRILAADQAWQAAQSNGTSSSLLQNPDGTPKLFASWRDNFDQGLATPRGITGDPAVTPQSEFKQANGVWTWNDPTHGAITIK